MIKNKYENRIKYGNGNAESLARNSRESMPDNVTISIWNPSSSFIHSSTASRAEPSDGNYCFR